MKTKKLLKFKKTSPTDHQKDVDSNKDDIGEILHFERQMADDLNNIVDKWCANGIPQTNAVVFPSYYWANFVFSCVDPIEANHILMKAISRELLRYEEIKREEISTQ
tara:strand:- start:10 stop:330 length:321 start_codon:yes stop_codon:yes gene_type:complete